MRYFPILNVPRGSAESIEQLGTKPKFWFKHFELGECLCKLTRPHTGEDWSEKVAAELADALGLPHARYEPGRYEEQMCVVSPRFLPKVCTLVHGNELLGQTNRSYGTLNVSRFRARAHIVEAVWDVLQQSDCELPLGWTPPPGIRSSTDVFLGYLLLDAIIGNTDRHDENWAIVEAPEEARGRRHLAPTFDHASCLGCHLTDDNRRDRLVTKDAGFTAEVYADKARSAFFSDQEASHPMLTLEAFQRAAALSPKAARLWREILHARADGLYGLLDALPRDRCSEVSAEFARRMMVHNVKRVVEVADKQ